ncbi:MAG TPA: hypothetical protein VNA69_22215 [Thermoanaerobaculia bacterium]|nr:hypothetical protein [Thermoanaerobaculia bacterium]
MTKAEREQWRAVTTEQDAETFVTEFLARRPANFAAEVTKRAEMADKYLTVGKVKGSSSLRGKLIVLFGAPAAMQSAQKRSKTDYTSGASEMGGGGELGVHVSASTPGGVQAIGGRGATGGRVVTEYTFIFSAKNVPSLGSDLTVVVEVDPASGKDRFSDKKTAEALKAKFEAIAQASITSR